MGDGWGKSENFLNVCIKIQIKFFFFLIFQHRSLFYIEIISVEWWNETNRARKNLSHPRYLSLHCVVLY